MLELRDLGDLHDYTIEKTIIDGTTMDISFDCKGEDRRRIRAHFTDVRDFELVDHVFGSIIDEIREIPADELDEYHSYPVRHRPSIRDRIAWLDREEAARRRIWVIGSSYGLQAAILAGGLKLTELPPEPNPSV